MAHTLRLTISDEAMEVLRDLRPFFGTTDDQGTLHKALAAAKLVADYSRPVDGNRCVLLHRDDDVPLAVILSVICP